ncbi:MAG: FAD-dependent oxidoreductase [Alphaproteobacteria bacterium]|nr:MAG: FAD-dependent oxidoreductase [Alphaproteobacteria bacterium]
MAPRHPTRFVVVGAGAAGLMTARELARAGKRVTIIEARERCGGRIYPLPSEEFGYPAEGGPEFVHGAAPLTRALMREAGLALEPRGGTRWSTRTGALSPDESSLPHAGRFYQALSAVKADLPIAEFLETHFAGRQYDALRRAVTRTVEAYDAADPWRASTLALRDEWMARDDGQHGRIAQGYGGLIEYLASECRRHGVALHLGAAVTGRVAVRCCDGATFEADAAILTVPPPLLSEIALPLAARERAAAAADMGFGNVVKILFRFATKWWADHGGRDLANLSFLISDATVPTWWTQHPAAYPVLTGWFAGPKADRVSSLTEAELIDMGLASLAEIFDLPPNRISRNLVAARAINWGNDPFARGAYSYATLKTREAQSVLRKPIGEAIFVSGEALYAGPDMGTVEAALASGQQTAQTILMRSPTTPSRARRV